MPDPFAWFFSQNFDYVRPYKNQVKPGYKGHPIEFMVDFFRPFRTIWEQWRPFKTTLDILGPFFTLYDHFLPLRTL